MSSKFYVTLAEIIEEISFKIAHMPEDPSKIKITSRDINRLGLQLIGSLTDFDNSRILTMGVSEDHFLSTLESDEIYKSIEAILSLKPPVLIITAGIKPIPGREVKSSIFEGTSPLKSETIFLHMPIIFFAFVL